MANESCKELGQNIIDDIDSLLLQDFKFQTYLRFGQFAESFADTVSMTDVQKAALLEEFIMKEEKASKSIDELKRIIKQSVLKLADCECD